MQDLEKEVQSLDEQLRELQAKRDEKFAELCENLYGVKLNSEFECSLRIGREKEPKPRKVKCVGYAEESGIPLLSPKKKDTGEWSSRRFKMPVEPRL